MSDFVDTMLKIAKVATEKVDDHEDDDDSDLEEFDLTLDELQNALLPTPDN
eukprot:COSAG02_NODE_3673_length_6394_cov_306.295314_2_plen_51_part_00